MSYVPKMLKNFPSANVEEKNGDTRAVMKGGSSLDLNQSFEEMDPKLNLALNSTDTIKLNPSKASEPRHGKHVIHREEGEYGCKYCPKKFSNKQALGGHQNAHKIERFTARGAWQGHEAHFGYTGNHSFTGMTSFPFPSSFNQAPIKDINQSVMNSSYYPQSMQYQMHTHDYPGYMFPMSHESHVQHLMHAHHDYPGSMFPMSHESHVVQPLQELSSFCTHPSPQFMSFHTRMGQGANTSQGKFSASAKNDQAEHNSQSNNPESQHLEDAGLDLSLKL